MFRFTLLFAASVDELDGLGLLAPALLPPGFLLASDDPGFEVVLAVDFGAAAFVSAGFAGPAPAPERLPPPVISAFSENSFTLKTENFTLTISAFNLLSMKCNFYYVNAC